MATRAANTRLAREYKVIQENPPEYITAHPSEQNILEWHYIITGPPNTPYHGGQYWGTLVFPANYPFAPPAIRMHTPSGRFQPSTRLCLSISDFHPKSFNPAWGISTILIGLLSFMTSEEMTTGSISATEQERRLLARRSRWWNSTGGGSRSSYSTSTTTTGRGTTANAGAIKAGDGGARFRSEWPDLDAANQKWMKEHRIDPLTGNTLPDPSMNPSGNNNNTNNKNCAPVTLRRPMTNSGGPATAAGAADTAAGGRSWMARNKIWIGAILVFGYVLIARIVGDADGWS